MHKTRASRAIRAAVGTPCAPNTARQSSPALSSSRYAAFTYAGPAHATGMLFVGLDDKSSANRTSRFVKRASPSTAPPNSSSAQAIASQIQYFTASEEVMGNGVHFNLKKL